MRCVVALLFGTVLLGAADPQFPAAAFYWDATRVVIVAGEAPEQAFQTATKMPERNLRPPFGEMFALAGVSQSDGIKIGDRFDINLTGNFWVRATVNGFVYNKTEYEKWMLAMATIDPDDRERYAAAIAANLCVFLAEPAKAGRVSDTGSIHNPVVKTGLSASERAVLEAHLNQRMLAKLHQAMRKEPGAANELLSRLLQGKATLIVDIDQVDFGQPFGVLQHVLGTWSIGDQTVFSIQGWKRPGADQIDSLEAIDGMPEDKAEIIGAIGDWEEESLDNFTIKNVFTGGRLVRHSAGYESSVIYLERMTAKRGVFERSFYGA